MLVLRNGEVDSHISMRFSEWYRVPRHLEDAQFLGMYALLASVLRFSNAETFCRILGPI